MLKTVRESRQLSQSELARQSGVDVHKLQKYEQGQKNLNNARLKTLCQLSIALDCRISELLSEPELIEICKKAEL